MASPGAIETLILWENLSVMRYQLKGPDDVMEIRYLRPEEEKDAVFQDKVGPYGSAGRHGTDHPFMCALWPRCLLRTATSRMWWRKCC